MIKRFFLDGINGEPGASAVGRQFHTAIGVLAHKTEATISGLKLTLARTQIAYNSASTRSIVPPASGDGTAGSRE
jgi:hypothetical protein